MPRPSREEKSYLHPVLLILPKTADHKQMVLEWLKNDQPITDLHWLNQDNESFKIAQSRELRKQLSYTPSGDKQSFILLYANKATLPAQNALLKSLEEPPPKTQLILTTSQPSSLLGTVQSRCRKIVIKSDSKEISPGEEPKTGNTDFIKTLLNTPNKITYSQIITLAEKHKDRDQALKLIENMIQHLHQNLTSNKKTNPKTTKTIKTLLTAYQQLQQNGNVRLVLEGCFFEVKKRIYL